jgi:hypothetical protein
MVLELAYEANYLTLTCIILSSFCLTANDFLGSNI